MNYGGDYVAVGGMCYKWKQRPNDHLIYHIDNIIFLIILIIVE